MLRYALLTKKLSTANLGLSDSQYKFLAEKANCIIHNGADVSLLKTYQSLRRAMFFRHAHFAKWPFHHDEDEPVYEVPASTAVPELLNSIDGYAASKWVSETLVEKAAADTGLPTYVHRLAHVVGSDASELDAVGMLTKYSIRLRVFPRIKKEHVTGQWDFVTVQEVAKDFVNSAIGSTTTSTSGTTFINHCSKLKVPHDGLRAYLEKVSGITLQEVDMKEWLRLAGEKGLHPLVHEFLAAFSKGKGPMVLPMIAKSVSPGDSTAPNKSSQ